MPDLEKLNPNRFKPWPEPKEDRKKPRSLKDLIKLYSTGHAGALYSPEAKERFSSLVTHKSGSDVCRKFGYEESGKGQLIIPAHFIELSYPGCLPGGRQAEGDCVSWNDRNATLCTMVMEALCGLPDPVSGKLETLPKVSLLAIRNGVLSTEAHYGLRTTKPGHGWYCHEGAEVCIKYIGAVLRQNYSHIEGGIDLEKYTSQTVNHWNRRKPSPELLAVWDDHLVRDAVEIDAMEALRDLLYRGFGVSTCGSEAFSSTRNEDGVCQLIRDEWAHAMAFLGIDDRPWAHAKYGGPLILVQNSWGDYCKGPRDIHDPPVPGMKIPVGSFWTPWKNVRRRLMIAYAGINGWLRNPLPSYSTGIL